MGLTTRVWGAGKVLVLLGALFATFLLFAAASMRIALRTREVKVPDFTTHTPNEATAMASGLDLTIKVDDARRVDPKIAAGLVIAQDPRAGTTIRRQRSVKVWLSAGARPSTVPSLVGEAERTATLRLAQDGLTLTTVSEIRAPDYPFDVVVAQDPARDAGAGQVSLLVNRAESGGTFVMPDLIGVNGDRAATILRGRGFRVSIVGSLPYPGVAAGIVLRQSPQAGFQIAPGEPISIEVSR
ncbi:MAG TPA: PASTA domain-containing protein [Vicinamibacterales bacterium]|nr:PASTA domain-containing protein [Vicinamibacterales bacterium]